MSLPNHYEEERPWGGFERLTLNEPVTVKFLRITPSKRLSLQRHQKRSEWWRVLTGNGTASVDDAEYTIAAGSTVEVPQGATHRLEAGPDGLTLLEIAFGDFDENDIERLEDDFGRTGTTTGPAHVWNP